MDVIQIPDLTFPMIEYGKTETPWNLAPLLYVGGARSYVKRVNQLIEAGKLGTPLMGRINLLLEIHEEIKSFLVGGGSKASAYGCITSLRYFYSWADDNGHIILERDSVELHFRQWCDSLLNSARLNLFTVKTAYGIATNISRILDEILERKVSLIRSTHLIFPRKSDRAVDSVEADKQNLAQTFEFGHLLLDIINGLKDETYKGNLPIVVNFRTGKSLEFWCGLRQNKHVPLEGKGWLFRGQTERIRATRLARDADQTLRMRHSVVNLRIEAELLIFIAQTGMNLAQAHSLTVNQYAYKSSIDGYEVRDFKKRRHGEVLFEIFAEYKPIFETYLVWRNSLFPHSLELFPFIRHGGQALSTAPGFHRMNEVCKKLDAPLFRPKLLRKTRINWLLRQSRDPELTAEQAQHTVQTLLDSYEKPSLQVAMVEIIQFWPEHDPTLQNYSQACPAMGTCNGVPKVIQHLSSDAPKPDCRNPSGCLFCEHHRDIDSDDYVWSLASMRFLKTMILTSYRLDPKDKNYGGHVELAINALTEKLKWFKYSNELRKNWVVEAMNRIEEADYHPHWKYLIDSAEGV